jgi:dTDP-4-dehydrorhamnose reductase
MNVPLRLMITGASGKIARSLAARSAGAGVEVQAIGRPKFDLSDPASLEIGLRAWRPDILISAAAYTSVAGAENDPQLAHTLNVSGAEALATYACRLGIPIVHLSSSYVFDGMKPLPYREVDPAGPINVYGNTKLLGEMAVARAHTEHVILRLSWVYGPSGWNFVTAMLEQAEKADEVRVVGDQIGSPTSVTDVADGIISVCKTLARDGHRREYFGTFHLAGPDVIAPAAFAAAIFSQSAKRGGPHANVVPISSEQYSNLKRPPNTALDASKLAEVYGILLPPLETSLIPCIEQILESRV